MNIHPLLQQHLQHRLDEWTRHEIPLAAPLLAQLQHVWTCSDFIAQACLDFPIILQNLSADDELMKTLTLNDYQQRLQNILTMTDDISFARQLRLIRKQYMVRIAWRDLTGLASVDETLQDLSNFADCCILTTLDYIIKSLSRPYGTPVDAEGYVQPLLVIAVGKLGGQELNFSSDIDLIFAYPQPGYTLNGLQRISNQEFFTKVIQKFIRIMTQPLREGLVFRVDLRLRPHGDGGALVMNFTTLETYYQEQGRDWERYAMVKARIINPASSDSIKLHKVLLSFVYRRYVDFSIVESLRSLKDLIQREIAVKGLQNDVKRGPGGIREIEFICQTLQLIRGGRFKNLQLNNLLQVLTQLLQDNLLEKNSIEQLTTAYRFFRRLENCLQMQNDAQTHQLPHSQLGELQISYAMGYKNFSDLIHDFSLHRANVTKHFNAMLYTEKDDYQTNERLLDEQLLNLWNSRLELDIASNILTTLGFDNADAVYNIIQMLRQNRKFKSLSQIARMRLDNFIPLLLRYVSKINNAQVTLMRIITLLEAIMQRSAYLALLTENLQALQHLIKLFSLSAWIAEQVTSQPFLLEVLLDDTVLRTPLSHEELHEQLSQTLKTLPNADYEQCLEELRRFKLRQLLQVAAAEITGHLNAAQVSEHLTAMATAILVQVLQLATQALSVKFPEINAVSQKLAIVAYGKLGACELNYTSDLDLVFLHDNAPEQEYYTLRLTQYIVHVLNIRTAAGILYQVDTRLRPSGDAGLLVSHIDAFAHYQQYRAWTWEHQALVRARVICGPPSITTQFNQVRCDVLTQTRALAELRVAIEEMRQKMRENSAKVASDLFDLKQGSGGIIDIEFLVQFWVLAYSAKQPELLTSTQTAAIINTFAAGAQLTSSEAARLSDIYIKFRSLQHYAILHNEPTVVPAMQVHAECEWVAELWQQWLLPW